MKWPLAALLLGLCSLAAACEDDSSQANARDRAVSAACKRYDQCGAIRPKGGEYVSMENCRVEQSGAWERQWPPAECDGRVDAQQLELCINSIEAAECGEALDILNIIFNKCAKSKVCAGASK